MVTMASQLHEHCGSTVLSDPTCLLSSNGCKELRPPTLHPGIQACAIVSSHHKGA